MASCSTLQIGVVDTFRVPAPHVETTPIWRGRIPVREAQGGTGEDATCNCVSSKAAEKLSKASGKYNFTSVHSPEPSTLTPGRLQGHVPRNMLMFSTSPESIIEVDVLNNFNLLVALNETSGDHHSHSE